MNVRRALFTFSLIACLILPRATATARDDWLPVSDEELGLQDDPLEPGAAAVVLYQETFSNHVDSYEKNYKRIKVLTEAGKTYAEVRIPYYRGYWAWRNSAIKDLEARTIRPDGTIVPFRGEVYEDGAELEDHRILFKTFAIPAVEVGSIIEYRYRHTWDYRLLPVTDWDLQGPLSVLRADFRVLPTKRSLSSLGWIGSNLPVGSEIEPQSDGSVRVELENIPAFHGEEYMPPAILYKMRVRFFYHGRRQESLDEFWNDAAKAALERENDFIGDHDAIRREANALVLPDDTPLTRLRKLYDRTQRVRNLSFEPDRTEKETDREELEENNNVKDVLEHGYAYSWQINNLFIALARAAGFDAAGAWIVTRNRDLFVPDFRDFNQLNERLVWVDLDDRRYYMDPGRPFTPFGSLHWFQTGVRGIRLHQGGGERIEIPTPASRHATRSRTARLRLDDAGNLTGSVTAAWHGLTGIQRRVWGAHDDERARHERVERWVKQWFPANVEIEIETISAWDETAEPLQVEFSIRLPDFAVLTEKRLLFPIGALQTMDKRMLARAERSLPVHFPYAWEEKDELIVEIPFDFGVEGLPAERQLRRPFGEYRIRCEPQPDRVQITRHLTVGGNFFEVEHYPKLRDFFRHAKDGDSQYVVLGRSESSHGD